MTEFERKMLALREREVKALEQAQRAAIDKERAQHRDFIFNFTHYTWVDGAYQGRYIGASF